MKSTCFYLINAIFIGCALLVANVTSAQTTAAVSANTGYSRPSSVRIGLQGRYNAVNVGPLGLGSEATGGALASSYKNAIVPIITPGVRFLNDRLFLGLGFGFTGASTDREQVGGQVEDSQAAFSISPTAFFDVLSEPIAALSVGGWLTIESLSDNEECAGDNCSEGGGATAWGLNLAAGIRGKITPGLAIGGEFGWGFLSISNNEDTFYHGVFGNILFEASLGL
jgi:hypothetical protein